MTDGDVCPPKLAIVIHTEEEFDWGGGFNVDATSVSHGEEIFALVQSLSLMGAKTTLAMDYPFVSSAQGQNCIANIKASKEISKKVEFAAHLHPWVNPPFEQTVGFVPEHLSYPGNLGYEQERAKLAELTSKISEQTGTRPVTYLAGRYGIGDNTHQVLNELGYKIDVSISPFADYRHQHGPDFRNFNNDIKLENKILSWPHSSAVVSPFSFVRNYFNSSPTSYSSENLFIKVLKKVFRAKLHRLSPEGFSLTDMKNVVKFQNALGQTYFILSFHSPSVKAGLTPYVKNDRERGEFIEKILSFVNWFEESLNGEFITINEHPLVRKL